MANIASSVYTASTQADGRQQVHETHTDLVGVIYTIDYLASAQDNLSTNLAIHATNFGNDLANNEININVSQIELVGSLASPTFVYSTTAQNLAALRAAYKIATQTQAIMIGDFLSSLTNAQLQSIFSDTLAQINTLRTNFLTPAATNAAAIRAALGV